MVNGKDRSRRDDPEGQNPGDGPDPDGNWLEETYPLVDADFVGSTLDRVLNDRSEIDSEAACVEDHTFDDAVLSQYAAPPISRDFVETTLARVVAERRAELRYPNDAEHDFHVLIENAHVPEPSPGFVDQTLGAVLADREASRRADVGRSRFRLTRRGFSVVASAAAVVLCAVFLFTGPTGKATPPRIEATSVAQPLTWASLVTQSDGDQDDEVFRPVVSLHPLELLARQSEGGPR